MPPDSPSSHASLRPHPLAECLIERLRDRPASAVLDFASGRGRNTAALRRAGFAVYSVDDAAAAAKRPLAGIEEAFAAALSTHGLLHGTEVAIAARARAIAAHLEPDGLLFATLGSSRDARCGAGECLGPFTYAPCDGDEAGVPHTFFTRERLNALLDPLFTLESAEELVVDRIAGSWAHAEQPLAGAVHWYIVGRARPRCMTTKRRTLVGT